jgi:hypothetical protein
MCGGTPGPSKECGEDLPPCPNGYVCDEKGTCVDNPPVTCFGSAAEFALGKNSPISEGSEIIIPKDNGQQPLIVGQFTVQVPNCEKEKFFNLDAVTVNIRKGDNYFRFSDLELIHDLTGNGVVDPEDKVIATGELSNNFVKFFIPTPGDDTSKAVKKFPGSTLNYFIVRTKVDYTEEEIKSGTTFNFYLESSSSIEISDQGTAFVEAGDLEFASYMLEPTGDFFVITIGPNDPPVPPLSQMNDNIPILQLRTKALTKENSITSLKVKIPISGGYVKFGEKTGISEISLYIDSNKDGTGNVKVAEITEFDTISTTIVFNEFIQSLSYLSGEEKYLVVYAKFNMVATPEGEEPLSAKIEIPNGGIILSDRSVNSVQLPIKSKEFIYECKPGDADCETEPPSDPEGCNCSVVSVGSKDSAAIGVIIMMILAVILRSFFSYKKKSNS